jgi:hypothetical protein
VYRPRDIRGIAATLVLLSLACVARADDLDLGAEPAPSAVAWSGDFLLRQDIERSWSGGDNESRLLARLRYGLNWQIDPQWVFGAALRIDESSIGNEHLVDYNDNQRPRDLALDTFYLQYSPAEGQALEAGKDVFPLKLSRMLWDPDLRPAGLSYSMKRQLSDDTSLRFVAGAFLGQHLSGDQSRISAAQLGLRFREQDMVQPEFILSYLRFTHLSPLLDAGEDRGNPFEGDLIMKPNGGFLPDFNFFDQFELADLQFVLHVGTPTPFRLLLDMDKNLGAVRGNDRAGRIEMALGDSFTAGGSEVGLAAERMQHSAVQGAFNDDDWWFHAGSHGSMLWYAYGWSDRVRLRLAWFHEQPDTSRFHWDRWLLDLGWQL